MPELGLQTSLSQSDTALQQLGQAAEFLSSDCRGTFVPGASPGAGLQYGMQEED